MAETRPGTAAGFTLVEILAVLVIIGVVTGVVVLSIHTLGGGSPLGQAAERLAGRIQLASENARLENMQYGLRIEAQKYEFMRFNGHGWDTVTNDPVFAAQSLPDGATLDVHTHGEIKIPVASTAAGSAAAAAGAGTMTGGMESGDAATALTPQIAILSTGEITPFTLTLSTATKTYVLNGNGNGQIHVEPPGTNGSPASN